MPSWPWSKTYTVRCPDGTTRELHKDIDEAVPLSLKGFKADIEASVKGVPKLSGAAKAKYETKIQGLLFGLTEQNQSLMMSFRTVYLAFRSDPCGSRDFFQREVEKLLEEQRRIAELKLKVTALIQLASLSPADTAHITAVFVQLASGIGGTPVVAAASLEISESRKLAKDMLNQRGGG